MKAVKTLQLLAGATLALLLASSPFGLAAPAAKPPAENPYQVERSWPDYFLEHKQLFTEKAGTYKAGKYPAGTAKVSLTADQLRAVLAGKPAPAGVGDTGGLQRLLGYLDRQQPGFYMHVR